MPLIAVACPLDRSIPRVGTEPGSRLAPLPNSCLTRRRIRRRCSRGANSPPCSSAAYPRCRGVEPEWGSMRICAFIGQCCPISAQFRQSKRNSAICPSVEGAVLMWVRAEQGRSRGVTAGPGRVRRTASRGGRAAGGSCWAPAGYGVTPFHRASRRHAWPGRRSLRAASADSRHCKRRSCNSRRSQFLRA